MKKILLSLFITLLLTGCNATYRNEISDETAPISPPISDTQSTFPFESPLPTNEANTFLVIDETSGNENAAFYIDMSWDDVWNTLSTIDYGGEASVWGTDFDSNLDGGNHKTFETAYFSFTFDKNQKLYEFSVFTDLYRTKSGLKSGDDVSKMIDLYGDGYLEYQLSDGNSLYEYEINKRYFRVYEARGKIRGWAVFKYSAELLQSCVVSASPELPTVDAVSDTYAEFIEKNRRIEDVFREISNKCTTTNAELQGYSAEGAEVIGYFYDGELVKISSTSYGEGGKSEDDIYFDEDYAYWRNELLYYDVPTYIDNEIKIDNSEVFERIIYKGIIYSVDSNTSDIIEIETDGQTRLMEFVNACVDAITVKGDALPK
ncbi:MAG: lipoprotein [Clostridiales bacterium]|nr:lipoprotein [Clostridiales bacterium]